MNTERQVVVDNLVAQTEALKAEIQASQREIPLLTTKQWLLGLLIMTVMALGVGTAWGSSMARIQYQNEITMLATENRELELKLEAFGELLDALTNEMERHGTFD